MASDGGPGLGGPPPGLREVWEDARAFHLGDRTRTATASCKRVRPNAGETWVKARRALFLTFFEVGVRELRESKGYSPSQQNRADGIYAVSEVKSRLAPSYSDLLGNRHVLACFDWHLRWEREIQASTGTEAAPPQRAQSYPPPVPAPLLAHLGHVAQAAKRLAAILPPIAPPHEHLGQAGSRPARQGSAGGGGRDWLAGTTTPVPPHASSATSLATLVAPDPHLSRLHSHAAGLQLAPATDAYLQRRWAYGVAVGQLADKLTEEVSRAATARGAEWPTLDHAEFMRNLMFFVCAPALREAHRAADVTTDLPDSEEVRQELRRVGPPHYLATLHLGHSGVGLGHSWMPMPKTALGNDAWRQAASAVQAQVWAAWDGRPEVVALAVDYVRLAGVHRRITDQWYGLYPEALGSGTCAWCPPVG